MSGLDWIGKTMIVPLLIGAVCETFISPISLSIGVGLIICVTWIYGFEYFFEENVNTENST